MQQLKNSNGEDLYIFTVTRSDRIEPLVLISTWDKTSLWFKNKIEETPTIKLLNKHIQEDYMKATLYCKTYFMYVSVKPAYITYL